MLISLIIYWSLNDDDFIIFLIFIVAGLVGEEITATNANHIQAANMDTATDRRGNVSAIPIGEEFYAIKVKIS